MTDALTHIRLQQAAADHGFHIEAGREGRWHVYKGYVPATLRLGFEDDRYILSTDHADAIGELGAPRRPELDEGAFRAFEAPDTAALGHLVLRLWQLAKSLPQEPLREFEKQTTDLGETEIDRIRRERIGQGIFRDALMDYWQHRCPVTGITHPRLLRASHIIPWAECETDAERLDVYNGLLLAAHVDAAFDAHLLSFDEEGRVIYAPELTEHDRRRLRLGEDARITGLTERHQQRLARHQAQLEG